jgi:hypothetical protein
VSWAAPESSRLLSIAGIVAVFIAVGPPIGGFFYFTLGVIAPMLWHDLLTKGILETILSIPAAILASALVPVMAAPYSYIYGLMPAAVAGLVIGILRLRYGRLNVPLVLAVGGCVGIIFALTLRQPPSAAGFPFNVGSPSKLGVGEYPLLGLTCLFATLVCWRFVRTYPMAGEQ